MTQTNEFKQDKGLRMLGLIGGLPDDLILAGKPETDPCAGAYKRENWFLRMMSSPVAAVVLSVLVAAGVLFFIIRAGVGGGGLQPAGYGMTETTEAGIIIPKNKLMPAGTVTHIDISSLPEGYFCALDYSCNDSGKDMQAVLDCLLGMKAHRILWIEPKTGMVWVVTVTYADGSQSVLYGMDDCLQVDGRLFGISDDDGRALDKLLYGLTNPQVDEPNGVTVQAMKQVNRRAFSVSEEDVREPDELVLQYSQQP